MTSFSTTARRVKKPWGHELIWAETEQYVGKILHVRAGHSLSLQYHEIKHESWLIRSGAAIIELAPQVGDELEQIDGRPGDTFSFPPGTVHRITAIEDTDIFEVSTPHLDDVVRIEDLYGRG
jgi:mannose-6-phosphate isomerase-like protein (cupin superfamily)